VDCYREVLRNISNVKQCWIKIGKRWWSITQLSTWNGQANFWHPQLQPRSLKVVPSPSCPHLGYKLLLFSSARTQPFHLLYKISFLSHSTQCGTFTLHYINGKLYQPLWKNMVQMHLSNMGQNNKWIVSYFASFFIGTILQIALIYSLLYFNIQDFIK